MDQDETALRRFHDAQARYYDQALSEMRAGRKSSHWIWFIFPQIVELGRSSTAARYGIADVDEGREYLADPILRNRYREISAVLLEKLEAGVPLVRLMGSHVDALKLVSSQTYFLVLVRRMLTDAPDEELTGIEAMAALILQHAARQGFRVCEASRLAAEE